MYYQKHLTFSLKYGHLYGKSWFTLPPEMILGLLGELFGSKNPHVKQIVIRCTATKKSGQIEFQSIFEYSV
jgi:hypothetical protein